MDKQLEDMGQAYSIMRQALSLLGWSQYYDQITLRPADIHELLYYSNRANERDFPLCCIVRGILFDSIPELYQTLK